MGREVIPPLNQTNSFPNKATWQATSHPSPPTSYPLPPTHSPQSDSTCTMRGKQLWQVYDEETVIGLQHGCGIQAKQLSFSVKSRRLPPFSPLLCRSCAGQAGFGGVSQRCIRHGSALFPSPSAHFFRSHFALSSCPNTGLK